MLSFHFKNFEISSNNETWEVDNFDLPLTFPKSKVDILLDLILLKFALGTKASFQIEINNNSQLKLLEINTGNVAKEIKLGTEYFPIIEIFNQLSKLLNIQISPQNWSKLLINLNTVHLNSLEEFQKQIKLIDDTFPALDQNKLNNNKSPRLNDVQTETKERFNEINSRIEVLEKELESNVNGGKKEKELNSQITSLESEINTSNASISSVTDLIKKRDSVVIELRKLEPLSSDSELISKVETIKKRRFEKLFAYLSNLGSRLGSKFNNGNAADESRGKKVVIKFLLVLTIFQLVFSIVLYLYSLNNRIIYITFAGLLVQVVLIMLANIVKPFSFKSIDDLTLSTLENSEERGRESENKFLIDSAWIDALKKELWSIEKTIKVNLKNRELTQVKGEIEQKQHEIENLKNELSNLSNTSLSQEEYLKKRRNLDILKIERENLQADLPPDQINDLNVKTDIKRDNLLLPLIIMGLRNLETKLQTELQANLDRLRNERQIIVLDVE